VRLRLGELGFKVSPGKKFVRPHLNGKKLGMVVQAYHPSDDGKPKIGG
jgi:hypothetical protein